MIIDVAEVPFERESTLRSTICVIGAGAAGLTVTRELARRGVDVIVLEAGGLKETKRSQQVYAGDKTGQNYFKLEHARKRYLGGSTNCWAGLCAKLRPLDFETRSWIPHSGWPISRSDIDPYYDRAGEWLGIGGFHPQLDLPREKDQHLSGPGLKVDGFESVFFQMSKPARLGEEWREELHAQEEVRLLVNANVTHLQLSPDGQRLQHVTCQPFDGAPFKVQAEHFVLACGGIENPRMLLNARDISSEGIGNQRGLVGRFFMEHPHIDRESIWIPAGAVPSLAHYHRRTRPRRKDRIWPYLRPRAEQLAEEELLDFSLVLFKRSSIDKEAKQHPLLREMFQSSEHLYRAGKTESKGEARSLKHLYTFGNPMEQSPNPDSRVSLSPRGERDELGLIRLQLDWRLSPLEKRTLRRGHEMIAEAFATADYGRVRVTPTRTPTTFPKQTKGGYHHMGTTRMSETETTGVVDRHCKVFGVSNLFVGGSSVFTTSGAANPTLTIVALALRLAEHLHHLVTQAEAPVETRKSREK